jgi:hypothetical protein
MPAPRTKAAAPRLATLVAARAGKPVKFDGRLGDPVWQQAQVYPLNLSLEAQGKGQRLQEPGNMRLAWDAQSLYLGIDFTDSDVVAEGTQDGQHHYTLGDLAEFFIWPEDQTWYWELYVTPKNHQTTFFFPGGGRLGIPSTFSQGFRLKTAARVEGTLNDWTDRDRGWTAEMAVPVKELTARGEKWGPGSKWRILVARYNYSRYLWTKELSMCPALPGGSYHAREHYGRLVFG